MRTFESIADLAASKGELLGTSHWVTITQEAIDLFADASGDHQWIHVDPERAASGPFGTTIAHGFMTLSMLADLIPQTYTVKGVKMVVNYGVNKVRLPAPVPVDSRVRAHTTLVDVEELSDGNAQITLSATVELEGGTKPVTVAELLLRFFT